MAAQSLLLPPLPVKQTWLQRMCGFKGKAKPRILGKVLNARVDAMHIKSEAQLLEEDEDKEILLLKHFILSQLSGYKRAIAERYLLGEGRFASMKHHSVAYRRTTRYMGMIILPILWLALIYMIYVFHLPLASRSSIIWLVVTVLMLCLDFACLQPGRIWLKWVVINGTVVQDMTDIVHALRLRFMSILVRDTGVLRDAHSLVQHFNPACRAARLFPHLPVSRYLMALNDSDTPYVLRKPGGTLQKKEGWILWIAHTLGSLVPLALLVWITSTPAPLQDTIVDLAIVFFFYVLAFVLYGTSLLDITLPIVILVGIGAAVLLRESVIWRSEYSAKMKIVLAMEKKREEAKLQELYSGSRAGTATDTASRAGDDHSAAAGSVMTKPSISPKTRGNSRRVVPIAEDIDDTYDDGEFYDEEAANNADIMREMEGEKVDVIGSFVREMNSVVTFRSKFKPQEGEFHRSPTGMGGGSVTGQDVYGEFGLRGGDADTIASTISSTSLQSSLLMQGRVRRDKGGLLPLTQAHMQANEQRPGSDHIDSLDESSISGTHQNERNMRLGLFDGDMTLRKGGSPSSAQHLELHEFDSDSQYSSASGVSHGRRVRLAPLGGSTKSNSPSLPGSQFSNPHHAYHPSSARHYATSSLSGGESVASSIAASIKQVESNLSKNLETILAASAEKAQAQAAHGTRQSKKKKRVRGSGLMLDSIAGSRPGTAEEGEEYIPSPMHSKTSSVSPLSKGEFSAQDLFGGHNSDDDADAEDEDRSERKIRTTKKSGAQRRRERWNRTLEEAQRSPESPSVRTSKKSTTLEVRGSPDWHHQ